MLAKRRSVCARATCCAVSAPSLRPADRKAGLYAAAGIPDCWIVDLTARVVEVYSAPCSGGYASQRTAAPGEVMRAIAVPELAIAELMPPAA